MRSILCSVLIFVSLVNANIFYDLSKEEYNKVKDSRNFTGKVVLVTGSSSGIGEGVVKLFSLLGAQVVITGRNTTRIYKVAQEVKELSPKKFKPLEVIGDVTKSEDLNRLLNQTIKTYGKIDVLVNNAGFAATTQLDDKNFMKTYDSLFNTDLRAVAELNHLAVPYLKKTNGTIIHISSIAGLAPTKGYTPYSMAKAGMDMMTRCLALELGPFCIRVNSINPGLIITDELLDNTLLHDALLKFIDNVAKITPVRRVGQVLDIAKGVAFLASSDSSFITGANLVIDGGLVHNSGAYNNLS